MAELENVFHAITSKVPFANNNSNINVPSEEPASNVVIKKTVSAASEPLKTTTGHRPTTAINNVDKKTTGSTIAPVKKAVMTMQRVPLAPRPATAPPRAPMTMSMTTKPMSQVMKPPHMLGKGHSIIQLKSTWGNDTAARKKIMEQRRLAEVRSIQEAVQREAEMRKKVLTMRKEAESKKKQHERETFQAFSSDRSHATKEADRLKKERRKQSVLVNADILRKSRENAAAIEAAKKQEEADLLQTRHEDHLKVTEARKMEEQRRRESMVNRGLSAQQQREIMEQLVATKHDEEVSLLQSRREDFLKLTEARKMEEQRRRESMVNRGLTARQHQEIAEQMEQENHNEEVSLLDSRREDHLKMTEARRAEVQLRRESMVNRGLMAQQHRQIATQMEQEKHDEATDSLHFRRYLANQKAESEKDETRRSRESLAGRLDTWRAQRSVEERMDNARDEDDRSLLHTKHANWVDTNEHKKRLDTARRESLAVRLDEWRRQKVVVEKDNSEKSEAERIEWELKQQDAEDIKTYREVCRASRRESLAMRLDKARNDADVEEALRQQEAILMAEEYRLKDEDHAAVTKYRAEEDAARRKSLEFRNRQGVCAVSVCCCRFVIVLVFLVAD